MPPRRRFGVRRRRGSRPGWVRNVRRRMQSGRATFARASTRVKRSSRYRSRRPRRVTRRRFSRRSKRPSASSSFRKKVVNALAEWRTFTAEYGQEHTVSRLTDAKSCFYFTVERYAQLNTKDDVPTIELYDWNHVMNIADFLRVNTGLFNFPITAAFGNNVVGADLRLKYLLKGKQISTIRNQSTEAVNITAYYCRPRAQHVNFGDTATGGVEHNTYKFLAQGFANNGIDPGLPLPSLNEGMLDGNYSPFESFDFTHNFKVVKVRKVHIVPSSEKTFVLSSSSKLLRPLDYINNAGTTSGFANWSSSRRKYTMLRPAQFLLFKVTTRPAGWGAVQAGYSKQIQQTSPTIIMDTTFRYKAKIVPSYPSTNSVIEQVGIAINGATAPAIIVADGDAVGTEMDAV